MAEDRLKTIIIYSLAAGCKPLITQNAAATGTMSV
jgi:hypothetical protein